MTTHIFKMVSPLEPPYIVWYVTIFEIHSKPMYKMLLVNWRQTSFRQWMKVNPRIWYGFVAVKPLPSKLLNPHLFVRLIAIKFRQCQKKKREEKTYRRRWSFDNAVQESERILDPIICREAVTVSWEFSSWSCPQSCHWVKTWRVKLVRFPKDKFRYSFHKSKYPTVEISINISRISISVSHHSVSCCMVTISWTWISITCTSTTDAGFGDTQSIVIVTTCQQTWCIKWNLLIELIERKPVW